jgi:hypothetical protein
LPRFAIGLFLGLLLSLNRGPKLKHAPRGKEFLLSMCCRLTPTLSGIAKGELRQTTLSVNDLLISCRTSYTTSVA